MLSGAAAGLVIALQLPIKNARPAGIAASDTDTINTWLRIAPDGEVTFLCDRSEMGQGVWTALPTLLAEELELPVEQIRIAVAPAGDIYINNLLGGQVTGGSTSVRDAWEKLRRAGAEARLRLIAAAAERWGVSADKLQVENGAVVNPAGESLSYGALATAAAAIPAPDDIPLKPAADFTQIGQPRTRLDTPAKLDGTATFGIDVQLPNLLYASLAQSPVLGGRAQAFDASKAEAMPGIQKIVDTSSGIAVIAKTWWQAKQARDSLSIDWEPGDNIDLDNGRIYAGLRDAADGRLDEAQIAREDGDVDVALAAAAGQLDAVYELPMLAHATLEPQNCTAELRDGELHVYVPTQVQQFAQAAAAQAAGLPPERVHIHTTFLGGGFGRRLDSDFIAAAVESALAVGRPVKLVWTREDDTTHDVYRPPIHHRCRAAWDAHGHLTAWRFDIVGPSITARWLPAVVETQFDPFAAEAAANYPYDTPNVRVGFLRHEVGIEVGYWRSVSHATNCFSAESFIDELAHALERDPYEFRRGLLAKQTEPRWLNVLERAAEAANWGQTRAGRHQGIALMEGYGTYMAQVAEVSVRGGKLEIHKITCATDCGQMINPSIVESQVQGSIVFGLSAALWGEINIAGGQVQEQNFDTIRVLRIDELPELELVTVKSEAAPGGMGEPATALVAPAVCNAIFAATGMRIRSLPLAAHGLV
jgi:isoquinoline 1-oxidoreductase beta subunit